MKNDYSARAACTVCILLWSLNADAMGLRSFVALPVDKGGAVGRLVLEKNTDSDSSTLITNYAYGISTRQTLLLGLPYRVSPGGSNRTGDPGVLYRNILRQTDQVHGTQRLALLAGVIVATDTARDHAVQLGLVNTIYRQRHELDFDMLYQAGLNDRKDSGRYDLSWQYRLSPVVYPDWGFGTEWNSVLEINGRWNEGTQTTHQVTAGLQWIHPEWVLEGGLVRDINNNHETRILLGTRIHF